MKIWETEEDRRRQKTTNRGNKFSELFDPRLVSVSVFENLSTSSTIFSRARDKMESEDTNSGTASLLGARVRCRNKLSLKLASNNLPYLIRSNFIKTTYDISLDSQISFLPLGFSPLKRLSHSHQPINTLLQEFLSLLWFSFS